MLPDLRFAFGAMLAIAMLAVAGFGLAISSQLLHEARVSSLEPAPALAYAGQAKNNPFYDPDSAMRFTRALGQPDEATALPPVATPPEPIPAPPTIPDESAAVPVHRAEASTAGAEAAEPAPAPATEPTPTPAAETSPTPTPAPSQETKPPEATETSAPSDNPKPPEATREAAGDGARPVEPEAVANAPAASPGTDIRKAEDAQPSVGNPAESAPPPAPAAKPVHRRPRPRVARARQPAQQGSQYSGFPSSNTPWPSYGNQWGSPPATKMKNGSSAGRQ